MAEDMKFTAKRTWVRLSDGKLMINVDYFFSGEEIIESKTHDIDPSLTKAQIYAVLEDYCQTLYDTIKDGRAKKLDILEYLGNTYIKSVS